jgi:hypothetical protein
MRETSERRFVARGVCDLGLLFCEWTNVHFPLAPLAGRGPG